MWLNQNFTANPSHTANHQKSRCVPFDVQPKVSEEIERIQEEERFEKLSGCFKESFISPIVVEVKKDHSIKLAIDSKVLNEANHKFQKNNFNQVFTI